MFDVATDVNVNIVAHKKSTKYGNAIRKAATIDIAELCDIASNPNTSVDVLKELASTRVTYAAKAVASNHNSDIDVLKVLWEHNKNVYNDVVGLMLENPNMTLEFFIQIATEYNFEKFRYAVARNPNTPDEVLEVLALKASRLLTEILIRNINAPVEVFENLATVNDMTTTNYRKILDRLSTFEKYADWPEEWLTEYFKAGVGVK